MLIFSDIYVWCYTKFCKVCINKKYLNVFIFLYLSIQIKSDAEIYYTL